MPLPFYAPPESPVAEPFWDAVRERRLVMPRCSACGRWQWYPDEAGPDCADADYEWVDVAATGVLHTRTRVHRPFLPGSKDALPFSVGLIVLDGVEGPRLVGLLDDDAELAIGDRVRACFVDVDGDVRPLFGPEAEATRDSVTP